MAGLLDFGEEDDRKQNIGLLGLLAGLGVMGANQPGQRPGQAIGQGALTGLNSYAQQQALSQRAARDKQQQNYQNQMLEMNQQRLVPDIIRQYEYAKKNDGYAGTFEEFKSTVAGRNEVPANIREWEAFNKLSKEDQARYLTMKRSNPYQNFGGFMALPNQAAPGQFQAVVEKTPPPEQMPGFKGAQAYQTAAGGVQGTQQATAAVNLPQTIAQAEESIKLIDSILDDPAMPKVVGVPESLSGATSRMGAPVMGSPEAGFMAKVDQLTGRQFLQAFETLKGGGQITEVEGKKATDAISRMTKLGQSEESYRQAAEEFKQIIQNAVNRAKMKAGQSAGGATGGWSIQRVD